MRKEKRNGTGRGRGAAAALLVLGAAAFLFTGGFAGAADYGKGEAGYLKSATYYSDDWVINFWNSESIHMEEELAQIADDGFNNIILAVPWREFQPGTSPCSYNEYAWEKLDRVMETAERQNLSVMLRVGYTWDYYSSESVLERYEELVCEESMRQAWLEYVERLYARASAHPNFCGGFLTWEDFWNFTESSLSYGKGAAGKRMARECGYTEYARENYSLEELEQMYGHSLESYEELYLPPGKSEARKVFYSYYDDFLNRLLAKSQQVFPDLSMEVRLDVDPVEHEDGSLEGFMHISTYPCGSASYTSTMFGIPMGFANEYERVTAQEAVEKAPVFFNRLRVYSGGKPVYVDQFLFTDNTVGFEHNAQLLDGEKEAYLDQMAGVLSSMTMGYGIWTYRDYGDNKLYNAQFGLDLDGWEAYGTDCVEEENGNHMARIAPGGRLAQNMSQRVTGQGGKDTYLRLRISGEGKSRITVRIGGQTKTLETEGDQVEELRFSSCSPSDITISCVGKKAVCVDDIQVYTHISRGELYEMDGSEGPCLEALRRLNQNL